MCMKIISCNPTVDCGTPPPPVNGSFLQPHTNTTEGSVVVFQCEPGFVPKGVMTAVCGRDGQWTPSPGGVTCSPRPTQMFTQIVTQVSILTSSSIPTGPGKKVCNTWTKYNNLIIITQGSLKMGHLCNTKGAWYSSIVPLLCYLAFDLENEILAVASYWKILSLITRLYPQQTGRGESLETKI